jgi:MAF protein
MSWVLASSSPRRRALMGRVGVPFVVQSADIDEEHFTASDPAAVAEELAVRKAQAVAAWHTDPAWIIGSDTVVALDGEMLGKPENSADARQMLQRLAGRTHQVHTGLALAGPSAMLLSTVLTSQVTMRPYSSAEIAVYVATGDPLDKAGAYAIQHPAFRPVAALDGCYAAVMGFPLCQLVGMMQQVDPAIPAAAAEWCREWHDRLPDWFDHAL